MQVEHRIGIQAPAEVVWGVLADLRNWGEWNPTYPKASGHIRIGAILALTMTLPGNHPQEIEVTVLDWVPNEQLHWRMTGQRGFMKTTRYIEIEALGDASSIVSNGEFFGGLLGPSFAKRAGRTFYRGFLGMNEALKARAEEAWASQKG